jgi:hypothetical protein
MAVLAVAAGCVTISSPSQGPSAASSPTINATLRPTQAASATTSAATATPVVVPGTPTALATAPETTSVLPSASPDAAEGDAIMFDEMDDPSTGWQTGQSGSVSVEYLEGNLRLSIDAPGQAVWSPNYFTEEYGVLLFAGAFRLSNNGVIGALCRTSLNELYGALITTAHRLVFVKIIGGEFERLAVHEDLDFELPAGQTIGFGVECAGMSTGALRLVAVLQGRGTLGTFQTNQGPSSFNSVALEAEALDEPVDVDVEQAAAYAISGSADGPSPEGEELLTHVPPDWGETCIDTPSTSEATSVANCFLQTEGVGAEFAIFQQFATQDAMDAAYQEILDLYGVGAEGDCKSAPAETTWSINDQPGGKLQCAPQTVGIRFDWTDDNLLILSTLFDFDGDYENTYNLWVEAGPF